MTKNLLISVFLILVLVLGAYVWSYDEICEFHFQGVFVEENPDGKYETNFFLAGGYTERFVFSCAAVWEWDGYKIKQTLFPEFQWSFRKITGNSSAIAVIYKGKVRVLDRRTDIWENITLMATLGGYLPSPPPVPPPQENCTLCSDVLAVGDDLWLFYHGGRSLRYNCTDKTFQSFDLPDSEALIVSSAEREGKIYAIDHNTGNIFCFDDVSWSLYSNFPEPDETGIIFSAGTDLWAYKSLYDLFLDLQPGWEQYFTGVYNIGFSSFYGPSADDIYGAGGYHSIIHWDGSAWTVVLPPDSDRDATGFWDIDGCDETHVYAVGGCDRIYNPVTAEWIPFQENPRP